MTYAPATLVELVAYWTRQGGVNLGVVGDTAHVAKGYSYHLGADHLAADAYSTKTARDKAGVTNAASAIDLGKLGGSYPALRLFSVWLVGQGRIDAPGTRDMREIIYSPDGATVLRWDRERGYQSAPRGGEADNSHLTHTHISWYRDAEKRDHVTAFRPWFEAHEMSDAWEPIAAAPGQFTVTGAGGNAIDAISGAYYPMPDGYVRTVTSRVRWTAGKYKGQDGYLGSRADRPIILMAFLGEYHRPIPPTPPPADCSAVEAELADLTDRVDAAVKILEGG